MRGALSLTGYVLFQYAGESTTVNNQNWMERKFNAVRLMERSSLASRAVAEMTGEGVEECGLSTREYVFCGGGFPIRLKSGEPGCRGACLGLAGRTGSWLFD